MNCASCGSPLPPPPWFRSDECPRCAASLHSCVHCGFYEPGAFNSCREPQAERVVDKERANFCDCFSARGSAASGVDGKEAAKKALEALFKK